MNPVVLKDVIFFAEHFKFIEEFRGSKIMITGATGLIGSSIIHCINELNNRYEANIQMIALVRNVEKAKSIFNNEKIIVKSYDLEKPINLDDVYVDYIFHCACPTSSKFYIENPVELIKTSVQGSISILDYALKHSIKGMVYLSSCEVYGSVGNDDVEFDEDYSGYVNPIDVRSGYPQSKRLVETLCHSYYKEYKVPVIIARLTQTFGAGVSIEDNRVFAQFSKSAVKNEDIIMHTLGNSAKPYCYTTDVVNALFYLLIKGTFGEAYNVANSSSYITIKKLAELIAKRYSTISQVKVHELENMGYAPVTKLRMSTKKLTDLGWQPYYSLENMFDNLVEYYKTII